MKFEIQLYKDFGKTKLPLQTINAETEKEALYYAAVNCKDSQIFLEDDDFYEDVKTDERFKFVDFDTNNSFYLMDINATINGKKINTSEVCDAKPEIKFAFTVNDDGTVENPPKIVDRSSEINVLDTHSIQYYDYDDNTIYFAKPALTQSNKLFANTVNNQKMKVKNERGFYVVNPDLVILRSGYTNITLEDFQNFFLSKTKYNFVPTKLAEYLQSLAGKGLFNLSEYSWIYPDGIKLYKNNSTSKELDYLFDLLNKTAGTNDVAIIAEMFSEGIR